MQVMEPLVNGTSQKRLAVLMQSDCLQLCKLIAVHKGISMSALANKALHEYIASELLADDTLYNLVSNMVTTPGSLTHDGLCQISDLRRNR